MITGIERLNSRMKYIRTLFPLVLLLVFIWNIQSCLSSSPEITWQKADSIVNNILSGTFPERYYPITSYGAKPDINTLSTHAINEAIRICSEEGGGVVIVPEGTFFTGAVRLRSNVNFYLEEGAVLKFSTDPEDFLPVVKTRWEGVDCYNYSPLIYAYEEKNIAITGKGILDGQANQTNWWPWKGRKEFGWKEGMKSQSDSAGRDLLMSYEEKNIPVEERIMGRGSYLRPPFIQFFACDIVLIENITVQNSPFWIIHPLLSQNIIIRGVKTISHGPNNDGCDPESCSNVLIENCFFDTGDDCVAIKSGRNNDGRNWNLPSENIVLRECIMQNGHGGFVIGSEISGGCNNVFIEKCKMNSPELERAVRIKTNSFRGGTINNVFIRNLEVGEVSEAVIKFNCMYEINNGEKGDFIPVIKDIYIENITSGKSTYALFLQGVPGENNIYDIYFRDCIFNGVSKTNRMTDVGFVELQNVQVNLSSSR